METRQISLSFDKAKQWYKGTDETLKVLALQAYTVQELNPSVVQEALDYIGKTSYTTLTINCLDSNFLDRLEATARLHDIAEYLNKGWKKEEGNTGYFISYDSMAIAPGNTNWEKRYFKVNKHERVCLPLVYFRSEKDAWAVIEYFGKDYLNLITTF